jgi:hypothetical protein
MGKVANDDRHDWSDAWALFPGDVAYVWFSGRHAASVQLSLEKHQLLVRNLIVWEKNRPVISRGHYSWQAETCLYAVRQGKRAHWNARRSQPNLWKNRAIIVRLSRKRRGEVVDSIAVRFRPST